VVSWTAGDEEGDDDVAERWDDGVVADPGAAAGVCYSSEDTTAPPQRAGCGYVGNSDIVVFT
jgi:hypothetical protein